MEIAVDRRHFLSTTLLSGAALVGFAGQARAFSQQDCSATPGTVACQELMRHHELLAKLDDALKAKGLDAEQRKAVLATAICPFCGQPLIG